MSSELAPFLAFLATQPARLAARFPGVPGALGLSFTGTCSRPGAYAELSIHRLLGVAPGQTARELTVALQGALPRPPGEGESITVHLTGLDERQGYQAKTRRLGPDGALDALLATAAGRAGFAVRGQELYTVHPSPWTLRFFEAIPFAAVEALAARVPFALVGVGETVNVSPRFVFHHEVRGRRAALFHGEGLAFKASRNLRVNRLETRLVLDPDRFEGFALRGVAEEFGEHDHPLAWARIHAGFEAGGWSRPTRCYRLETEDVLPIGPIARPIRRRLPVATPAGGARDRRGRR